MKKNRLIIQGIILINSTRTKKDDVISIDGENLAVFYLWATFQHIIQVGCWVSFCQAASSIRKPIR